jgi:hypothetical protein
MKETVEANRLEAAQLSPYGIRALSHYHTEHPHVFRVGDHDYRVSYVPAKPDSGMCGGNSNLARSDLDACHQVAEEISNRLANIFLRGKDARRAVYGGTRKFQDDPHWRDYILFYEYFQGDNGAGLGASHQTGWTGIIARAMHLFATTTPEQVLEMGKAAPFVETQPARTRVAAPGR